MKLFELFLTETTEEERAILSLSSAISNHIKKYKDIEPEQHNYDDDDYDSDYDDDLDIHGDEDYPQDIGTIGQLFDTPLDILNPVRLELQSDYGIRQRIKREDESDKQILKPGSDDILGLWYSDSKTIVLNKDYLESPSLKSAVSHELRHALDDFKSDFRANKPNTKYTKPKIKSIRKLSDKDDPHGLKILAEPAEINARFSQVLHAMTPVIARSVKLDPYYADRLIKNQLNNELDRYLIADFFPHKQNSKEYKRFIKRAMDFVQKEKKYQEDLLKSKKD